MIAREDDEHRTLLDEINGGGHNDAKGDQWSVSG